MPRKPEKLDLAGKEEFDEGSTTPRSSASARKRGRPLSSTTTDSHPSNHNTTPATTSSGRPVRERIATPNAMNLTRYGRGKDDGASGAPTSGRPTRDASTPNAATAASSTARSEPPPKRRRYIPGGAGGGGRFIEVEGTMTLNTPNPVIRAPRRPARESRTPSTVIPKRERSTRIRTATNTDDMEFSSAAAVAAAVAQNEGYKPREERGWEEFHPHLDIDATFMMFRSEEVDGIMQPRPTTPKEPSPSENMSSTPLREVNPASTGNTPNPAAEGLPETPQKRRPVRPTREASSYFSRTDSAIFSTPKTPQILPIRNQTAKEKLDLKAPSYRRSDRVAQFETKSFGQARYVEKSMMNVGYQESDQYIRPEERMLKATDGNIEDEADTALSSKPGGEAAPVLTTSAPVGRVEYDMDEQDDMWLESLNVERKKHDLEPITREIFEIALTKIEKEWHALEKRIPKPNPKPPQTHRPRSSSAAAVNGEPQVGEEQDSKCAICDDGDCENTNAIVFCDGCDLAVHQECYGVPFIPEGQWLCRKCQLIGRGLPTCIFCPNTDGAFKQTNSSKWAHLLCAMWIPEVSLGNHTFMEPVMDVDKVPKTRWKLTCYICNQKMGACIQCSNKSCYQAFHVTCARRSKLFLKMKNSQGALAVLDNSMILKAFCDKHCPPDWNKEHAVARATREARKFYKKTMKGRIWADNQQTAQALAATHRHALTEHPFDESQMTGAKLSSLMGGDQRKGQSGKPMWKLPSGAPVVPQAVFDIVEMSLSRFTLRKRKDFVGEACRYWTLKREARRGAALLKRLQLQMESFSSMELTRRNFPAMGPSGKPRLARRIEFAETLIKDLGQLKVLSDKLVEREQQKLEAAELEREFVDTCYFPIARLLPPVVDKALALDKGVFYDGLIKLQSDLAVRFHTATLAFTRDLCQVISVGINTELKGAEAEEEESAATTVGKVSYEDVRQRKTLGKRILKAVQPQLEAALQIESEITSKPIDALTKDLESIMEACLEVQQPSTSITVSNGEEAIEEDADVSMVDAPNQGEITVANGAEDREAEIDAEGEEDAMEVDADGELDDGNIDVVTANTTPADGDAKVEAESQHSRKIPEDMETNSLAVSVDGEAHNIRSESVPIVEEQKHHGDASAPSNPTSSDTPPATNGYQAAPPPPHPAPPTPPQSIGSLVGSSNHQNNSSSNGSQGHPNASHSSSSSADTVPAVEPADSLSEGGISWHLRDFKPRGTTVLAEQWPGRDALRSLSEDLSDMDDGELEGLGVDVDDSTINVSSDGGVGDAAVDVKFKAAAKIRKKTRSSGRKR